MKGADPVLFRELPVIQKIIDDETWLEGERRGCYVSPDDRIVRDRVCEIVLRIGQELRESVTAALARSSNAAVTTARMDESASRSRDSRAGEAA